MKRFVCWVLGLGLLVAAGLVHVPALQAQGQKDSADKEREALLNRGHWVYVAYCAACHGIKGDGGGLGEQGFAQRPTNFIEGNYVLRSALGAVPAPGDLERSIRFGMSGTEMVPFGRILSKDSIHAVAEYIRTFSPDLADPQVQPEDDELVKVPTQRPFPPSAETIAEGKQIFEDQCSDCHGDTGEGNKDETDDLGYPVDMVSFHLGYYKSGHTDEDLWRSIVTGMNGTSMDAYKEEISAEDTWKVVDYIRSLSQGANKGLIYSLFRSRPSGFDYTSY